MKEKLEEIASKETVEIQSKYLTDKDFDEAIKELHRLYGIDEYGNPINKNYLVE